MKRIEVKKGTIFRSSVTNIEPSAKGYAGTKNAKFYSNDIYGNIVKNTLNGIYGIYTKIQVIKKHMKLDRIMILNLVKPIF